MIIRQPPKPKRRYLQMPNAWARDERLSRRARGLLAELLSHEDGWQTTVEELVRRGPEGRDAIHATIRELTSLGYLVLAQGRRRGGRMGEATYTISDPPPPTAFQEAADQEAVNQEAVHREAVDQDAYKNTTSKKTNKNTTTNIDTPSLPDGTATQSQRDYLSDIATVLEDYAPEAADEARGYLAKELSAAFASVVIKAAYGTLARAVHPDKPEDYLPGPRLRSVS